MKRCDWFGHRIKRTLGFDPEHWGNYLLLTCKRCPWEEVYHYDEVAG